MNPNSSQQELIPASYSPDEVRAAAKSDLDFFGGLVMPDDCTLRFPDYYKSLFVILVDALGLTRDFSKFALGFPRGHGKTQFLKLLIVCSIIFTKKQFILVICASQDLAENVIRDVWDILESPNVRAIFGTIKNDVQKDTGQFKQFTYNGLPRIIAAAGCGTSIRGFNVKNRRPDFIILDDAQTKDCAASISEARKYITWFTGTLMKAKAPTGCTYMYVGNMYPDLVVQKTSDGNDLYACQLRNLQKNKYWKSFIVGAILADQTALWEELQPLQQLLEEFEQDLSMGQGDVFCAEVLNDPQALPFAGMDFNKVYVHEGIPGELHQGSYIIIDPATNKKGADDTAIGYFEVFDAKPVLTRLTSEVLSPVQTIEHALRLALEVGCTLICVESVAYQATLLQWFQYICMQQGITGIEFQPVHPRGVSKNARILAMFRSLMAGELGGTQATAAQAFHQIRAFNPHITTNKDDILDLLAYAPVVLGEYGGYMSLAGGSVEIDWEFQQLPEADSYISAF